MHAILPHLIYTVQMNNPVICICWKYSHVTNVSYLLAQSIVQHILFHVINAWLCVHVHKVYTTNTIHPIAFNWINSVSNLQIKFDTQSVNKKS